MAASASSSDYESMLKENHHIVGVFIFLSVLSCAGIFPVIYLVQKLARKPSEWSPVNIFKVKCCFLVYLKGVPKKM